MTPAEKECREAWGQAAVVYWYVDERLRRMEDATQEMWRGPDPFSQAVWDGLKRNTKP